MPNRIQEEVGNMKKILAGLVALTFLFGSSSAVVAAGETIGDPGKSWSIPNDADRGMHIQEFLDSQPVEPISYLIDRKLEQNRFVDPTCKGIDDPRCQSESLDYSAVLPSCGLLSNVFCIEEFGVVSATGENSKAQFSRYFAPQALNKFEASERLKLPYGASGSIFELSSAPHEGGNLYYISVLTEGQVNKNSGANLGRLSIQIHPVKLENNVWGTTAEADAGYSVETNGGNGHTVGQWRRAGNGFSGGNFCVAASVKENLCAQRYSFPANQKFYLKLKLQNKPLGWMHGRINKPEVQVSEVNGSYNLSVSAYPVAVPVVYKMYRYPEMPQALKDSYDFKTGQYKPEVATRSPNPSDAPQGCGRSACTEDPLTRNVIILPSPSSQFGMDQLKLWLPFVQDKASALLGTWSLRTLDRNEASGAQGCFTNGDKGVTGIVTTNATQYSAGPPTLNKNEGTLEYQVAAPHFTTKGDEFLGTYDLIMRSDVARCVYGFTSAPIRAELSIVNDQGNQKVATEILGEKNGWLYLSAGGFTYSSPTIKVKLEQDAPAPVPTPTPTPSASTKAQVKAVTITCIKGKMTKKVTAAKPKCPTGYKKK
jgi:hypothetical protein